MLDAQWLVQIYANDINGDPCIGTGYSIGNGLILTARHVVLFDGRAKDPQLKLVWPEQGNHVMPFNDADIKFPDDEKIDLAIILCPQITPFQSPKVKLATVNPSSTDRWQTRGFPRAGKEENTRTDIGISGTFEGMKTHVSTLNPMVRAISNRHGQRILSN